MRCSILLLLAGLVGLAAVWCDRAVATPIASDDFLDSDFDNELHGENGGAGWSGAWSASTGSTELVDVSYSYTVPGGGLITANSALQVSGNNNSLVSRSLASSQSDEVYISFLMNFADGAITNNDFTVWWFNDYNGPNIGIKANQGDGSGPEDVVARTNGGSVYSQDLGIDTTHLVVGHLYKSGAGNYDRYALWVDPAADDFASPDDTATGSSDISSFTTVGIRSVNLTGDDSINFAALRLGTEWTDVVEGAVPPPPTETIFSDAFDLDPGTAGPTGRTGLDPLREQAWAEEIIGGSGNDIFATGGEAILQSDGVNGGDFDTRRITRTINATGFENLSFSLSAREDDTLESDDVLSVEADFGSGWAELLSVSDDFGQQTWLAYLPPEANDSLFSLRITGYTNVEDYYLDLFSLDGSPLASGVIPEPSTLLVWSLLAGVGIGMGWRQRRRGRGTLRGGRTRTPRSPGSGSCLLKHSV